MSKVVAHPNSLLPGGTSPQFSLTKGFYMTPANLCTISFLNTLSAYPSSQPKPRIIALSSIGVTAASHAKTALPVRVFFKMITVPHLDKLGVHRIAAFASGRQWPAENNKLLGDPNDLLPQDWQTKVVEGSWGPDNVTVIQAALLTDGVETKKYRTGENELTGLYTISRRDVAHFITDDLLKNWSNYQGGELSVGY
ncbi:hypothetical protein FRB90_001081 [Tulasnella sp. 427]|nr:hypothetical protein FRB90_001081 [Tulasnella sp. 427]